MAVRRPFYAADMALTPKDLLAIERLEAKRDERGLSGGEAAKLRGLLARGSNEDKDDPQKGLLPPECITTTNDLPGHRITRVHGVVSDVSSSSVWTASAKGATALDAATAGLRHQAEVLGANAIVGLTASAFGAGGAITNMIGGDAVGVLLMGTAVTVEPSES